MTEQHQLLDATLRNDMSAFTERIFREIAPGAEFLSNWHINTMAYHLQACAEGTLKRLIITLPPRHLKSVLASVALPAFVLGHDPSKSIVCVSYSEKLAGKHARDFKSVMSADWYQRLFPSVRASRNKNTELEYVTVQNGGRLATSVEGTLTGRGGDMIIIDDPIKPDEAMSEAERKNVNEWYGRTLFSRLNNKKDGVIIIVMQRVHEEDLVGHVLGLEDWTVVNIPAIATEDTEYKYGADIEQIYLRRTDELIDPRREGEAELATTRNLLGNFNFQAQYQQNPMPVEGNLVKREWFQTYTERPLDALLDGIVHSWDTATEAGELNDFSVCTIWGVKGERYFLLEVVREKLEYPDLRKRALELISRDHPEVVVIERAGTGRALIQDIKRDTSQYVRGSTPRGDKESRMAGQSALIEQGRVYLPEQAPWKGVFLQEIMAFPGSKHDDQVDSLEQFLRFMRQPRGLYPGARQGQPKPRPQGRRGRSGRRPTTGDRTYSLNEMESIVRSRKNLI